MECLHERRPDRHLRAEDAVHHVHVHELGSRLLEQRQLVAEPEQVGGEDADRDVRAAPEQPLRLRVHDRAGSQRAGVRELPEELVRLRRRRVLVDDLRDGLDHRGRALALEDVPAHVDAGRSLLHRAVGHRQRVQLGQLLAAGHHDRDGAAGGHLLEALRRSSTS